MGTDELIADEWDEARELRLLDAQGESTGKILMADPTESEWHREVHPHWGEPPEVPRDFFQADWLAGFHLSIDSSGIHDGVHKAELGPVRQVECFGAPTPLNSLRILCGDNRTTVSAVDQEGRRVLAATLAPRAVRVTRLLRGSDL